MKMIFLFIFVVSSFVTLGQMPLSISGKNPIDTSIFGKWPIIAMARLTSDGKHALYIVNNQPIGNTTLVLQEICGSWQKKILGAVAADFTTDGKQCIFIKSKDTLCVFRFGDSLYSSVPQVDNYKLINIDSTTWIVYQSNILKMICCWNISTNEKKLFHNVRSMFIESGKVIVTSNEDYNGAQSSVIWDPSTGTEFKLGDGIEITNVKFDSLRRRLIYVLQKKDSLSDSKQIWIYNLDSNRAKMLVSDDSPGLPANMKIDRLFNPCFSKDGNRVYFTLAEKSSGFCRKNLSSVDVWSFQDKKLQAEQLNQIRPPVFLSAYDFNERKIRKLQDVDENVRVFVHSFGEVIVVNHQEANVSEGNWNAFASPKYYIVSSRTGERRRIFPQLNRVAIHSVSPDGMYLIALDLNSGNFFCAEIATDQVFNVTANLKIPPVDISADMPGQRSRGLNFVSWFDDKSFLLYDAFDILRIWLPSGKVENITNGYGRSHNISFKLAKQFLGHISISERILLLAFNKESKQSGFYQIELGKKGNPELLSMGNFSFPGLSTIEETKNGRGYLIPRCNATSSLNYYYTLDFRKFIPVSNIHPEKEFNWITSELVSFKSFSGKKNQGILYKPENFDKSKKYPIIFLIYERKSDKLNEFLVPDFAENELNISWFVSNGYLVFEPDIRYRNGYPGKSTYNSIYAALRHLSKLDGIDMRKVGLMGHSWGGYEVNYLICHSNLFKAAVSAAGISNMISDYGSLSHGGLSKKGFYELGQCRIGKNLWESPELFISNSPIFNCSSITTPLLMMNNKLDDAVPFFQGIELFTALRRLGKPAWLLQYDGEDHSILGYENRKDYSSRLKQFFDHYLKDSACPSWMFYGIPAKLKGISTGFELVREFESKAGKWVTPKEGSLLTDDERKKVIRLKNH